MSLRRRITLSVILGLAVVLVGIGTLVTGAVRQSTQAALEERIALTKALVHELDQEIQDALNALARAAAHSSPGADMEGMAEEIRRGTGDPGLFDGVAFLDGSGRVLWESPEGWTEAMGGPANKAGLREEPIAFEVHAGTPGVGLRVPMRHEGKTSGFVVAELNPQRLRRHLAAGHGVSGHVLAEVFNGQGRLVATSWGEARGITPHLSLVSYLVERGEPGVRLHVVKPPSQLPDHFIVYVPLTALPGWGVLIEQPRDVVLALPQRLRRWMIGVGLVILLAGGLVAWLDVRRVVTPLVALAQAAERIAGGDLITPIAIDRRDEVGLLARTLEMMRVRLRASLDEIQRWTRELEARVNERTEELTRLYQELQQKEQQRRALLNQVILAQEEERKRIARDLHDSVGQALTGLTMAMDNVEETLPPAMSEVKDRLGEIRTMLATTLEEVRRLMVALRPALLDDLGLIPAISWYAETQFKAAHVEFKVQTMNARRVSPQVETVLFRVIQEAITNVVKHAQAKHATIRLEFYPERVRAAVEDDGRGFDLTQVSRREGTWTALGLLGMEERVGLVGGTITILSAPSQGTKVLVEIPLPSEEGRDDDPGPHRR